MKILLGKKLKLVVFGLLTVAVLGFLASQPSRTNYGSSSGISVLDNGSNAFEKSIIAKLTKKDSDKDGLKDWEEDLWGTDPKNPDTDGDGTNDGDEVNQNRNPKVAGPNDELDQGYVLQKKENDSENFEGNLTATDLFSQNLFGEFLSLRGSNEYINDEDKDMLIASVIENTLSTGFDEQYKISDLNVTNDNSAVALKKYGNDFISITQLYSQDLTQDEIVVFENMLRTENKEDVVYLSESAGIYNMAVNKLTDIKIPSDLALIHLDIINSYSIISDALKDMSLALDDPIRGLNGFSVYTAVVEMQRGFFKEIKDYFIKNRILFSTDEAGYIWHVI